MKSDADTAVEELKDRARGFCEERDRGEFHNPKGLAIGISTEAAELLEVFRFKGLEQSRDAVSDSARGGVRDELADVLYLVLRFAQTNRIDPSTALDEKLAHDAERYPAEKPRGKNEKHDEYR